jgi:hypothetical protein
MHILMLNNCVLCENRSAEGHNVLEGINDSTFMYVFMYVQCNRLKFQKQRML